ncbi:peptidase M24, structural domain-containing protein [Schizophyllum amplum]|uniref:Peptidase M24, structural domain-containing protein n=1 Tax=Schizophyllum amplum TaxID=97359 RepID=A0A550CZM7_9AGAR|nr:peptidase M24, structural domain-containing protein [Auriculariopsis ampla]
MTQPSPQPSRSNTRSSDKTVTSRPTHVSRTSSGSRRHLGHDSTSTLVGSAFERKVNEMDTVPEQVNSTERLASLRALMEKENLQYYVVLSEDAHGSEYVAPADKRREFISGFNGSAGQAIISRNNAYLITDSRYWIQAHSQVDSNWQVIEAGKPGQPKDWIEFLSSRVKDAKIGIDARMISHEKATLLNSKIHPLGSKLAYPPQNLVDLVWRDKPQRSKACIFLHGLEFAGESANSKLAKVRDWIRKQPPDVSSYSRSAPRASQQHVGTLITSLPAIAYVLNLRGSDIPFNPVFQAYLYISLNPSSKYPHTLFVDKNKLKPEVIDYLKVIDVVQKEYTELWAWLRLRQWGEGKVIIAPETSYAVSLMLTHMRYTIAPSQIEVMMSVKNETELAGMRRAYHRDGLAFTRFLAWLENKLAQGYEVTEWEAGHRLTEFRRQYKPEWMGLAYENISATGPNAALPHYSPRKGSALVISRDTPYLNDSGGQYRDGTCDTTRTMHFGRPTPDMCEAYTKVLQGHIAIDSAIFPEGTSGQHLDVLARRALWKDGWNYMHGTGHGFGQFLTVHEGPHGFSSLVPLSPGHVITNEPGFYNAGHWGMRIESALVVTRVNTKREFNGPIWLGFERLTCVPIQTRMVKESMLTKEEKAWLKDHNQRCYEQLAPSLQGDKLTLKWLEREAKRGIGLANPTAGLTIDWD